jgi:hypothetical protein
MDLVGLYRTLRRRNRKQGGKVNRKKQTSPLLLHTFLEIRNANRRDMPDQSVRQESLPMRSHSSVPAAAIQALAYARINLLQRQDTRLRTSLPSHPDAREANPTVGSSSIFRCQRAQVRGPTTPLLGIGRIGMQPTRECMQPLPWALIIKQDHLRQSPIMALAGNPQDGTFYAGTRHSLEKSKFRPSNTLAYLSPHECGVCKDLPHRCVGIRLKSCIGRGEGMRWLQRIQRRR